MAEDSDLEKTEAPSQRRLDEAREAGDVPRSRELTTLVGLMVGSGGLWFLGESLARRLAGIMADGLRLDRKVAFDAPAALARASTEALEALYALAPLFVAVLAGAILAPIAIGGWVFTTKSLAPNFERLDPVAGLGRMFSLRGVIDLLKATGKAILIGSVGAWVIWSSRDAVVALSHESVPQAFGHAGHLVGHAFLMLTLAFSLLAVIDVPLQLWDYNRRHRMSRAELRQEARESEGDPQIKARIRAQQREMARRRMMAEVPKADVVVTNPTHFAVALKYKDGEMRAPVVVAKGRDLVAMRIRELGNRHGVPVLEAPPLARALYRHAELGDEIPRVLYAAVAEVLAYVFQLRNWRSGAGPRPSAPDDIAVPPGLDPAGGDA